MNWATGPAHQFAPIPSVRFGSLHGGPVKIPVLFSNPSSCILSGIAAFPRLVVHDAATTHHHCRQTCGCSSASLPTMPTYAGPQPSSSPFSLSQWAPECTLAVGANYEQHRSLRGLPVYFRSPTGGLFCPGSSRYEQKYRRGRVFTDRRVAASLRTPCGPASPENYKKVAHFGVVGILHHTTSI